MFQSFLRLALQFFIEHLNEALLDIHSQLGSDQENK